MDKQKKVMIIEDDPLLSIVAEKLVTKLGYTVVAKISTGEEALQNIKRYNPDILLTDVQLAGVLDGIQTVQELRENHIDIPVIFLSGDNAPSIIRKAKEVHYIDFLLKPVSSSSLSGPLNRAASHQIPEAQFAA